jgi:alkylation response protein AidB-like acyl-CoA dehydrogenase
MLLEAKGLRGPFACLNEARYGIIWGAMGAARDCYECALEYSKSRVQFGKLAHRFFSACAAEAGQHDAGDEQGHHDRAAHRKDEG